MPFPITILGPGQGRNKGSPAATYFRRYLYDWMSEMGPVLPEGMVIETGPVRLGHSSSGRPESRFHRVRSCACRNREPLVVRSGCGACAGTARRAKCRASPRRPEPRVVLRPGGATGADIRAGWNRQFPPEVAANEELD